MMILNNIKPISFTEYYENKGRDSMIKALLEEVINVKL